ncbi:hypothetical protein BofuT4_P099230.1 [Botrytis cinerea T4]|uniref:Uncharacterized protein n=1 Tax=Botryotinia fuckeliana (strain T4) TaxID=999810 RepID=G2YCC6_BOTF4|nr:hypothetical protein BofuT4_P099230.1 [Botrytis cinerea T4]
MNFLHAYSHLFCHLDIYSKSPSPITSSPNPDVSLLTILFDVSSGPTSHHIITARSQSSNARTHARTHEQRGTQKRNRLLHICRIPPSFASF